MGESRNALPFILLSALTTDAKADLKNIPQPFAITGFAVVQIGEKLMQKLTKRAFAGTRSAKCRDMRESLQKTPDKKQKPSHF